MSREIPEVVRAAAGLAATVLDEARKLPEKLPGLPVRIIGLAMQHAMKVQQQYAGFVARGDELFTGFRGDDEPGLATFDDDEDEPLPAPTGFRESAFDRAGDTEPTSDGPDLILDGDTDDLVETAVEGAAGTAPDTDEILDEIAIDELVDQTPTLEETAPAATKAVKAAVKAAAKTPKTPKAPKPPKPAQAARPAKPRKAAPAPATTEDAAAPKTAPPETAPPETAPPEAAPPEAASQGSSVDAAPTADAPTPTPTAAETVDTEPTADVATTVDVLTPAGEVAAVEGTVTDEGVAAPESPAEGTPASAGEAPTTEAPTSEAPTTEAPTTEAPATEAPAGPAAGNNGSNGAGSQTSTAAPIDGYDSFSVAQLRGRMRGYALSTVQDLVSYEEATRARAQYLTMLRNRLEKLEEQAVESSPLAPRGA